MRRVPLRSVLPARGRARRAAAAARPARGSADLVRTFYERRGTDRGRSTARTRAHASPRVARQRARAPQRLERAWALSGPKATFRELKLCSIPAHRRRSRRPRSSTRRCRSRKRRSAGRHVRAPVRRDGVRRLGQQRHASREHAGLSRRHFRELLYKHGSSSGLRTPKPPKWSDGRSFAHTRSCTSCHRRHGSVLLGAARPGLVRAARRDQDDPLGIRGAEAVRAMFLDEAAISRGSTTRRRDVHDFGEEGGTLYMVMEYVAGVSLRAWSARSAGRRGARDLRSVSRSARGTRAARSRRSTARARAPRHLADNIMLGFDGT